ncbi:MAG: hypothetical protein KDK91_30725, partial [Gammaproteobacteria bacterium]|nr:hypothetical protein [Gammaproteobacteria bacterium]
PVHLGRLRVYAPGQRIRTARIHLESFNTRAVRAGFELFAEDGTLVAVAENVRFRASSLVHRVGLSAAAYHIHHFLRPLPGTGGISAAPVLGSVATLIEDGIAPLREAGHCEENRLLLDMAARRAAYDIVLGFADRSDTIDLAPGRTGFADCGSDNDNVDDETLHAPAWNHLSRDAVTVMTSLVALLASSELAEAIEGNLRWKLVAQSDCPLPPLSEIVATVLQDDPAWSAECTMLLRAVAHLQAWLTTPAETNSEIDPEIENSADDDAVGAPTASDVFSSSVLEHFYCATPLARSQIDRVVATLRAIMTSWPDGRPLRILQLGIAAGGLTRALLPLLANGPVRSARPSLVVADTDESWVARIANLYARTPGLDAVHVTGALEELNTFGQFDVVVSANGLHQLKNGGVVLAGLKTRMAANAICILSETEPTAFHDVVFSGTQGWFDTAMIDGVAYGRLRDQESWMQAIAQAGFTAIDSHGRDRPALAVPGTSLIIAQKTKHNVSEKVDASAEAVSSMVTESSAASHETGDAEHPKPRRNALLIAADA